jgi:hypothetical protein
VQLAHAADLVHQRLHGLFGVRIPSYTRILGVCYGQRVFLCAECLDGLIEPLHLGVGCNVVGPQLCSICGICIRSQFLLRCHRFLLLLNRCGLGGVCLLLCRNVHPGPATF